VAKTEKDKAADRAREKEQKAQAAARADRAEAAATARDETVLDQVDPELGTTPDERIASDDNPLTPQGRQTTEEGKAEPGKAVRAIRSGTYPSDVYRKAGDVFRLTAGDEPASWMEEIDADEERALAEADDLLQKAMGAGVTPRELAAAQVAAGQQPASFSVDSVDKKAAASTTLQGTSQSTSPGKPQGKRPSDTSPI
jgi:hypothetical protein